MAGTAIARVNRMELENLLRSLPTWPVLVTVIVTLGLGAIGGAIHAWVQAESSSIPKGAAVGAVAALAVIYVAEPETPLALLGGSLVAGYSGEAILKALQARTLLAIKSNEINEQRAALARAAHALQTSDKEAARALGTELAAKYPRAPKI